MPSYKLTYFNGKGRAEAIRLMFAAAGQKFDDDRIKSEDWPEIKKKTPQGSLPVLNVDGTEICQSMAINRYVAREFKMYGKTNMESAFVDMILDTCLDMFLPFVKIFFNQNEEEKKQQMAEYMSEKIPVHLGNLEALIKQTGKNGFAVGSTLTLADCVLHNYIENCKLEEGLGKYPLLEKNRKTFEALPKIKDYLAKRPKTDF